MKHSKACYLTASILSVVLLFLLTPIQRYFSYLASTTYSIKWAWISLAEVAVMAVFFGLSLCWSRELSRNFRIPAEAVKAALALAALGIGIFLLQSSFHSRCFLRGSFLTGFSPILPAGGHKQKKLRFVFVPWRSFFAPYDLL